MALVSAHRGGALLSGAPDGSTAALAAAVACGAELVELDVVLTRDGVAGRRAGDVDLAELRSLCAAADRPLTTFDEALELLAGRVRPHLDLKPAPGVVRGPAVGGGAWEVAVVRRAVEVLGDDGVVVTTTHDASVAAVRAWARGAGLAGLPVGLSMGGGLSGPLRRRVAVGLSELFPRRRLARCDATLVVANRWLARWLHRRLARTGTPLLVWTVDDDGELRRWLASTAWVVTTNRPSRALDLRAAGERP